VDLVWPKTRVLKYGEDPHIRILGGKNGRVTLIYFGCAAYLGDVVPTGKRRLKANNDNYDVKTDSVCLKGFIVECV
jgi:hypothetical protein